MFGRGDCGFDCEMNGKSYFCCRSGKKTIIRIKNVVNQAIWM